MRAMKGNNKPVGCGVVEIGWFCIVNRFTFRAQKDIGMNA